MSRIGTRACATDRGSLVGVVVLMLALVRRWRSLVIDDEEDHFHFCGKYRVRNATKMHFPAAVVSIRKPKAQVISSAQVAQSSSWSTSFSGPLLQQHSSASASELASTLFFVVQINNGNPIEIAPSSEVDFTFTQGMVCPINLHYLFEATPEHRFEDHLVEDQEFGRRSRSAVLQGVLEVPNLDEHGLGLPLPRGQALIHVRLASSSRILTLLQLCSCSFVCCISIVCVIQRCSKGTRQADRLVSVHECAPDLSHRDAGDLDR